LEHDIPCPRSFPTRRSSDLPGTMSMDPESGDLYVANDVGNSILVFRGTDKGDVAPARVIKGNRTGLSTPIGVFVDAKNRELWVSDRKSTRLNSSHVAISYAV